MLRTLNYTSVMLLTMAMECWAQTSLGSIFGKVTDARGGKLEAATVELFEPGRKEMAWSATTDAKGAYNFNGITPGEYTLVVKLTGFETLSLAGVRIVAGGAGQQDIRLEASAGTSTRTVQGKPMIPAQIADVAGSILADLPLARRGAGNLAALSSSAVPAEANGGVVAFAMNGARVRSNAFLFEGVETNDYVSRGQGLVLTNLDAVSEFSAAPISAGARFGRAGGVVVNQTIRSGTDTYHGSFSGQLENSALSAISNTQAQSSYVKANDKAQPGSDRWLTGTIGGPIVKGYTYWFAAIQSRKTGVEATNEFTTLTGRGRDTLRGRYPSTRNANVDRLITANENALAYTNKSNIAIGSGRGDIEVGSYYRSARQNTKAWQPLFKLDHRLTDADFINLTYVTDRSSSDNYGPLNLNGFETGLEQRFSSIGGAWTRILSSRTTNEMRAFYNSQVVDRTSTGDNSLINSTPVVSIQGLASFGIASSIPSGARGSSFGVQDRVQMILGRHRVSVGFDFARESTRQTVPFNGRGTISFTAGGGFTGLGNYIDNFGGTSGTAERSYGDRTFYTKSPRQSYFVQDDWQILDGLKLTVGMRYEYFGQPMNGIGSAGYAGLFNLSPTTFEGPYNQNHPIQADRNNIAPNLGLTYSPDGQNGVMRWLAGERKTVFRVGASTGYDSYFNDILSGPAQSTPFQYQSQAISVVSTSATRGTSSWYSKLPSVRPATNALDGQSQVSRTLENPYYVRLYAGMQRELGRSVVLDISYAGTRGVRLYQMEDLNPLVPANLRQFPSGYTSARFTADQQNSRLDPLQGQRLVVGNGGNSSYHALQTHVQRRYRNGLMFQASYTFSKLMDTASDIYSRSSGYPTMALAQMPSPYLGLNSERAISSLDRRHRGVFTYVWDVPLLAKRRDAIGRMFGDWKVAGIATTQSGVPYSLLNGLDGDGFGGASTDRPDYNPSGQPGVRAVLSSTSATGYVNPDANNAPIRASEAMYIQRPTCVDPNGCRGGNLGRNTLRGSSLLNLDASLQKSFEFLERLRFQFRADFLNVTNTPHYGAYSGSSLYGGSGAGLGNNLQSTLGGRFLNEGYLDGGGRTVRLQLRFQF